MMPKRRKSKARHLKSPPIYVSIENPKKKNFFWLSLWGFVKKTLGVGLLLLFPAGGCLTYYIYIQDQFATLNRLVDHVVNAYEFLYEDCQNSKQEDIPKDIEQLKKTTVALVDHHKEMGKLVSLETYCAIHQLTYYTNYIFSLGDQKVCLSPKLKKSAEIDKIKIDVIDTYISKDRQSYLYLHPSKILSSFSKPAEKYKDTSCPSETPF